MVTLHFPEIILGVKILFPRIISTKRFRETEQKQKQTISRSSKNSCRKKKPPTGCDPSILIIYSSSIRKCQLFNPPVKLMHYTSAWWVYWYKWNNTYSRVLFIQSCFLEKFSVTIFVPYIVNRPATGGVLQCRSLVKVHNQRELLISEICRSTEMANK